MTHPSRGLSDADMLYDGKNYIAPGYAGWRLTPPKDAAAFRTWYRGTGPDGGDLLWFADSPDAGDPRCICSLCRALITPTAHPVLRAYISSMLAPEFELRFHHGCFLEGMRRLGLTLAPQPAGGG